MLRRRRKARAREGLGQVCVDQEDAQLKHLRAEEEERLEGAVFGTPSLTFSGGKDSKQSVSWQQLPAWEDEDDEELSVDISLPGRLRKLRRVAKEGVVSGSTFSERLRSQFEKLSGNPSWASLEDEDVSDSDSAEELLQRTGPLLERSTQFLPRGIIDIQRMTDANHCKRAEAVVQAVEFHPSANVLLTAGLHKSLDLFQVDGQVNPKLQSVHVEQFPIATAHFTRDGKEVIMTGGRKSFYIYDLVAGKVERSFVLSACDEKKFERFIVSPDNSTLAFMGRDGCIPLVSNKSKQWIATLKMNGDVRGLAFTPDSCHLLSTGSDGKVYVWDMATRDCSHCFTDEGCLTGTTLAVSQDGQFFACGSESGVVNVYGKNCLREEHPRPLRALMSLTTPISSACFNHTSEMLAIASRWKKNALRLVHLPSLTVFSNWPARASLNFVSALDVSPQSSYLVLGTAQGRAPLYRLGHFTNMSNISLLP